VVAPVSHRVRQQGAHKGRPYITMLDPFRLAEARFSSCSGDFALMEIFLGLRHLHTNYIQCRADRFVCERSAGLVAEGICRPGPLAGPTSVRRDGGERSQDERIPPGGIGGQYPSINWSI